MLAIFPDSNFHCFNLNDEADEDKEDAELRGILKNVMQDKPKYIENNNNTAETLFMSVTLD